MNMNKWKLLFYFIGTILVGVLAIISSGWISFQNADTPPGWAIYLAFSGLAFGVIALTFILVDVYRYSFLIKPERGVKVYNDIIKQVPYVQGIIDSLKNSIKTKKLRIDSKDFKGAIAEIERDFSLFLEDYFKRKRRLFIRRFISSILSIILIFSFLYIFDYTIDVYLSPDHRPGFDNMRMPKGKQWEWIVDGIYFSTVTFTTLGCGDTHPNNSVLARTIVICETVIFLFFFAIGINFALSYIQHALALRPDDMTKILTEELKKEAIK